MEINASRTVVRSKGGGTDGPEEDEEEVHYVNRDAFFRFLKSMLEAEEQQRANE